MFTDQQTGKNFNRPDYQAMKRIAKNKGDIIIVSELDRLGRSKEDTLKELRHFTDRGVRVMILEIPTTLIDYDKLDTDKESIGTMIMQTVNNLLVEMYATFAQAEMQKREKRQREGIQAKKDRGEWDGYGRPRAIDFSVFEAAYAKVLSGEVKPFECCRQLGMKTPTFYSYKKKYETLHGKQNG
jgi:DNA invertase Pin-like site-specific DNA recombinase